MTIIATIRRALSQRRYYEQRIAEYRATIADLERELMQSERRYQDALQDARGIHHDPVHVDCDGVRPARSVRVGRESGR